MNDNKLVELLRARRALRERLIHARSDSYRESLEDELKNINYKIKKEEERNENAGG